MAESKFQKTRKKKKIARIIACSSLSGLLVLGIVAFLGRDIGSFTVSLNQTDVRLALKRKKDDVENTTYLMVDKLPSFGQFTYSDFPSDDVLDSDLYDYRDAPGALKEATDDSDKGTLYYLKYTFYVANVGTSQAGFDVDYNILDDQKSTDGTNRSLLDTLHVMIYENEDDSHQKTIYAKAPLEGRVDENGNMVAKEYVSMSPSQAMNHQSEFLGFAEPFETDPIKQEVTKIASSTTPLLEPGKTKRYTFVCWIEGWDPSDLAMDVPEGATLKLGIKVNGYESKKIQ